MLELPKKWNHALLLEIPRKIEGLGGLCIMPLQTSGSPAKVDARIAKILNDLKPTGWDWLPEHLQRHESHKYGLTYWRLSTSHYTTDVCTQLENLGIKVEEIKNVTEEDFAQYAPATHKAPATKVPTSVAPDRLYQRTRALWKTANTKFSDWDSKFVKDIGTRLSKSQTLTVKQEQYLYKLFDRYHIQEDAVASIKEIKVTVETAKLKGGIKSGGTTIREYTGDNGFYAWLNVAQDSIKDLMEYFPELKLTQDELLDMHLTVMYSPDAVPLSAVDENKKMPDAQFIQSVKVNELTWWEGHDKEGYLVAKLDPSNIKHLHDKWKAVGAKPTFDSYEPHVTLKIGIKDTAKIKAWIAKKNKELQNPKRGLQLTLIQEQVEDLD